MYEEELEATRDRHVNERCRRKEGESKQGQTNNKAKQHSTPKAVTFQRKMS